MLKNKKSLTYYLILVDSFEMLNFVRRLFLI